MANSPGCDSFVEPSVEDKQFVTSASCDDFMANIEVIDPSI